MNTIIRAFNGVERALELLCAAAMVAIALLVVMDVMLRYVSGNPTLWTYDLIGKYLMVLLFYGMLSVTFGKHGHISVDILQYSMSRTQRHLCEAVSCILSVVVFAFLVYVMASRANGSFMSGDVLSGTIPWPTWPPYALAAAGTALLVLRLAVTAVGHVRSILGLSGAALPPLPGDLTESAGSMAE